MKSLNTIKKNVQEYTGLKGNDEVENFISQAKRYINAIKNGSMICNIDNTVSDSGMSRTIKFLSCEYNPPAPLARKKYQYLNYYFFFKMLGYTQVKDSDYFRITGCGMDMDMVFNTNYNNMHDLKRLGFITDKQCRELAQMTPSII